MIEQKKPTENQRKMQHLLVRAMKDEAWRQELLTNPKTPIERELGITLPQGVTIQVHEDTPTTIHLVLPPRQLRAVEVSDADLAQAASNDNATGTNASTDQDLCGDVPCDTTTCDCPPEYV